MSIFHSTVTRRDFMKSLGLAGTGIGVAAMVAPTFHDLDEVISSEVSQRPWYIKEVDEPMCEIDWSVLKTVDKNFEYLDANGVPQAVHPTLAQSGLTNDKKTELTAKQTAYRKQMATDNVPGYTLRDCIAHEASRWLPGAFGTYDALNGITSQGTYATIGVPKWQGTPEENTKMVKAVFRLWGVTEVGMRQWDDKSIKLGYDGVQATARKFAWQDVDKATQTDTQLILPSRAKWHVQILGQRPLMLAKRSPTVATNLSEDRANADLATSRFMFQAFLYGLGYLGIQQTMGPGQAYSVMMGLTEDSRMSGTSMSPEFGPALYGPAHFLTDLETVPTKPVDAGILRFCNTCKKCAEACPTNSLSHDSTSSWDTPTQWNRGGYKGYRRIPTDCLAQRLYANSYNNCSICISSCTFSKYSDAMIHEVVKTTIANTSIFNGFFSQMDRKFGYGPQLEANQSWWDLNLAQDHYRRG